MNCNSNRNTHFLIFYHCMYCFIFSILVLIKVFRLIYGGQDKDYSDFLTLVCYSKAIVEIVLAFWTVVL